MVSFYVKIWIWLLLAMGLSIFFANVGHALLATGLIFVIAIIKALLVAAYYMRLKWEPRYVAYILMVAIGCLVILFAGLVPDIVYVYGK